MVELRSGTAEAEIRESFATLRMTSDVAGGQPCGGIKADSSAALRDDKQVDDEDSTPFDKLREEFKQTVESNRTLVNRLAKANHKPGS